LVLNLPAARAAKSGPAGRGERETHFGCKKVNHRVAKTSRYQRLTGGPRVRGLSLCALNVLIASLSLK